MIGLLGINHKTAFQDVRQLFSFSEKEIIFFAEIVKQRTDITEIVVLSTCHRTEIYYYIEKSCNRKYDTVLLVMLHEFKNISDNYEDLFYKYSGIEAIKHLFRVISGVDSVVIGEGQIVKQVKDAYMHCTEAGLTEVVLMRLFQKCFETNKRVRTETSIQQGPSSLSYVAVDLCGKIFNDLAGKKVLFIGSGETGQIALHHMVKRGVNEIYVSNRTFENAVKLARDYSSTIVEFDVFKKYLPECDIIIVATGAQEPLIEVSDILMAQDMRNNLMQIFIDLSVPRNIESPVVAINNVQLFDVDYLQQIVKNTYDFRHASIKRANEIIDEMAQEYMYWFDDLELRPLIKAITRSIKMLRDEEMDICRQREEGDQFVIVDEYSNRLTQKYINNIIKNLRNLSKDNPATKNIVSKLFDF
jgi:glutamyl-tRNA reductase